jgi:hypothetical protein
MQALSFAVHNPLVCFGNAYPSMVLLLESLYIRTGDQVYRTLAKRWSKVMIALFRGRRRDRDDPLFRAGPSVAQLHGELR